MHSECLLCVTVCCGLYYSLLCCVLQFAVLCITVCCVVCCSLLFGLCRLACVPHADVVFPFFAWLGYINSGINPFIYAYSMKDFRRAFIRILCCCRCCYVTTSATTTTSSSAIAMPYSNTTSSSWCYCCYCCCCCCLHGSHNIVTFHF